MAATAQLLRANGCRVLGLDPDSAKCALAESSVVDFVLSSGADPVAWCLERTGGIGVDGVLITAATSSSDRVQLLRPAASEAALFWLA